MNLTLNVYTDDSLTEIKRTAEADRLKVPYRVALTVVSLLDDIDLDTIEDKTIFKLITGNVDKVDKIIKATFGLSEVEMESIDLMEMGEVALEIYKWAIDKINSLKGGQEKN